MKGITKRYGRVRCITVPGYREARHRYFMPEKKSFNVIR